MRAVLITGLLLFSAAPAAWADRVLERDHGWLAGTIQSQLDRDGRLIPYGKGAIFVPSMTHGFDEPLVTVYAGDEQVAESTTGTRIVLKPGAYRVELGSGTVGQRMEKVVHVRELHTTVVPAFWSGLSVHVVDTSYDSLRGAYELIRVDDREYLGIGFGTDEQAGESVATWILKPGLYKVVRVGENYRARTDFATVRVEEGHLTHFLLVLDEETSTFEGAGEVPVEELFILNSGLGQSLIIGGDLNFGSVRNPTTGTEGESFSLRGFVDGKVSYQSEGHRATARLQIEEGQTKVPDQPIAKTTDSAAIDALYVYNWTPWVGPYVRLGIETNLVPDFALFDEVDGATPRILDCRTVETERCASDGTVVDAGTNTTDRFRTSPPFGRTQLQEGAGVNVRFLKTVWVEASARVGIGARQDLTNGLFVRLSDARTGTVSFEKKFSTNRVGIETTLLATARLTRWALINFEVDSLVPFDDPSSTILDIVASVQLKLTRYLSINYRLDFERDPTFSEREPLEQTLFLRFSIEVF